MYARVLTSVRSASTLRDAAAFSFREFRIGALVQAVLREVPRRRDVDAAGCVAAPGLLVPPVVLT
jgi:hypothetical protein